jgi:cytosine/adenosine deaminase-related metal-dependent hydrolase
MMDHGQGMPAGLRETTQHSIEESLRLAKAWDGTEKGRLRYAFAPRFVLSCTEELLKAVAQLAREKNLRIHTHASENPTECDVVRQRTGRDNIVYLHELGLTGSHSTFAHCVWLTSDEQRLLRETGTVVCHCPSSNLKLASGIAKIPELIQEGVHVCLGADGAPCNNNLDLFLEMRLASLIHKPRVGPTGMSAQTVLDMATLEGARAIGMEDQLGSIEPGKLADIACVSLKAPHAIPASEDVVAQLVHSVNAGDVQHVLIDGRVEKRERELLTLDEEAVPRVAIDHARRLASKLA